MEMNTNSHIWLLAKSILAKGTVTIGVCCPTKYYEVLFSLFETWIKNPTVKT